jgi:membrane protein implicated in regulation of membrane protease activity
VSVSLQTGLGGGSHSAAVRGYDRFVALLVAILLAVLVLPAPWNVAAVAIGAAWEVTTALGGLWWSQSHAARVRAETLVGREVEVRTACRPLGQVRVKGEIWRARCDEGAAAGETVRVVGIDGLNLIVQSARPAPATASPPVSDPESEQNVGAGSLARSRIAERAALPCARACTRATADRR